MHQVIKLHEKFFTNFTQSPLLSSQFLSNFNISGQTFQKTFQNTNAVKKLVYYYNLYYYYYDYVVI